MSSGGQADREREKGGEKHPSNWEPKGAFILYRRVRRMAERQRFGKSLEDSEDCEKRKGKAGKRERQANVIFVSFFDQRR